MSWVESYLRYGWFFRRARTIVALLCGASPAELCDACGWRVYDFYLLKMDNGMIHFLHKKCAEDIFDVVVEDHGV